MRETEVELGPEDVAVLEPERTLVEVLDVKNRLLGAMQGVTRGMFAAMLGVTRPIWYRWYARGKAPVKVMDYLVILRRFPELRGQVFRHLLHRALTEVEDKGPGEP